MTTTGMLSKLAEGFLINESNITRQRSLIVQNIICMYGLEMTYDSLLEALKSSSHHSDSESHYPLCQSLHRHNFHQPEHGFSIHLVTFQQSGSQSSMR